MPIEIILICAVAYLIGSIPTGYWFAKYCFGIDVTQHGSGNIGATNVARVLGSKKYFVLIFLIDAGKAAVTLWLARLSVGSGLSPALEQSFLCVVAALLLIGNGFSIFLNFRGGKSVATLVGIVVVLYPLWFVGVLLAAWAFIVAITRRVFVASMGAAVIATIVYWCCALQYGLLLGFFLTLATVWLVWRHLSNIRQYFAQR